MSTLATFNKSLFAGLCLCTAALFTSFGIEKNFLSKQKSNSRVKTAYTDKENKLAERLAPFHISLNNINILITAFKAEQQLVVYIKRPTEPRYQRFASYDICSTSGMLGPKRQRGDGQVPEGFYYIDRFNPSSSFYLSLGLNYPNQADRIRAGKNDPGSDIFIHGSCVTIGCMPMTDELIKEIYILALQAHNSGQEKIPVYVFPFKFDGINADKFAARYKGDKAIQSFWSNLKRGYDSFKTTSRELKTSVNKNGEYMFNQ
ncbi:MAG: hypothetical protein EOP46_07055 [Sphingobacteriaceae bacterium]|nr:MAG: hypothetical protein EOP46_07055 [Sphingobacteriaceae bacterium]